MTSKHDCASEDDCILLVLIGQIKSTENLLLVSRGQLEAVAASALSRNVLRPIALH